MIKSFSSHGTIWDSAFTRFRLPIAVVFLMCGLVGCSNRFFFLITLPRFEHRWNFRISLPQEWRSSIPYVDESHEHAMIKFRREALKDTHGRLLMANVIVMVVRVPANTDPISFSVSCREKVPFKVVRVLPLKNDWNGVGFLGKYDDELGDHQLLVWHVVSGSLGYQVIGDACVDIADKAMPEIGAIIDSVKYQ